MNINDVAAQKTKIKKEINLYIQTEIEPILKIGRPVNHIDIGNILGFLYERNDLSVDQFFSYEILNSEEGIIVSIVYSSANNKFEIKKEQCLENIFNPLKKEVKKVMLMHMYNK